MKLSDEAGVLKVVETAWKPGLAMWAAAGLILVELWRPDLLGLLEPGRAAIVAAVLLLVGGYFSMVRRGWIFDEPRGEFVARRRYLFHARTERLPLHSLRRIVAEELGSANAVLLTLVHSAGKLRFRSGATSTEAEQVRSIVRQLQERLGLSARRFTDMQIIEEVRTHASEIATVGVIKLLKGWGLKQSRDWLRSGMPDTGANG